MSVSAFAPVLSIGSYFAPVSWDGDHTFVEQAEAIERSAQIENHPFFREARHRRELLTLWAAQEAVVTNPFSQILFRVLSNIPNVHVRSIMLPVVHGEHSSVKNGVATKSHPWLIWKLCGSMGLDGSNIRPTKAVTDFIHTLEAAADTPMKALGMLGIGNEKILLAEYRAVEICFDYAYPEADYRDFLRANIGEDEVHTELMGKAAIALTSLGYAPDEFIDGAKLGVAARYKYYDDLLTEGIAS